MKNEKLIEFKAQRVLKTILKDREQIKKEQIESFSNPKELILKSVELYEPIRYEDLIKLNKIRYRNLKIKDLKRTMTEMLKSLQNSIDLYKDLINRTEYWERKSTYNFNFEDWNTLKKANGKLTRYYNDIKRIHQKIESEEL